MLIACVGKLFFVQRFGKKNCQRKNAREIELLTLVWLVFALVLIRDWLAVFAVDDGGSGAVPGLKLFFNIVQFLA